MASRKQGQEQPYSTQQQYYQLHPAQASQFSLHTPTDPNPPNSSFRSPVMDQQQPVTGVGQQRLPRVFDGDESPVEENFNEQLRVREQQLPEVVEQEQSRLEYSVPEGIEDNHQPQGHEQQYQSPQHQYQSQEQYQDHEQQYQGHRQQQYQGQEQYQQQHQSQPQAQDLQYQQSSSSPPPPTDYLHQYQQGYDAHIQAQYSTPLPSPGFPQSQFEAQQTVRHTSQQYGPAPQYVSPPHSPSFPPPQRSATFRPPHLSFPPPPRSPSFIPHPQSPSYPPLPQSPGYPPHTPGFAPQTPTFPPPPTSEIYQPSVPVPQPRIMSSSVPPATETPAPTDQDVELITRPPEPIVAPTYTPGAGMEGPKTPLYTPGGGSGPNGGTHAPGQIGHPNQQIGKDEYQHGLCDCFGDIPTCCIGCWCPCILYSRTNHRLKTIPNSNLNDFHHCNTHCVGCCVLAPVSWIFTFLQRGRIRDKYHLEGTLMSDCGKAYCCVMCTLVQDEREVSDREDERRRNAGPGSGVVGETGYMRQSNMIYG